MQQHPPSPADALMQHPEQWMHIASPGHVLLARVNAYKYKTKSAGIALSVAVFIFIAALIIPPIIGGMIAKPIGKVVGWFESAASPSEPKKDPAPALKAISIKMPDSVADIGTYPPLATIEQALAGAAVALKDGKGIDGCDTESKITDAWSTETSAQPKCRMSADKSRLWVWGSAVRYRSYAPYIVLLRKDGDTVTTYNVQLSENTLKVGQHAQLPIAYAPRAVSQDFTELRN